MTETTPKLLRCPFCGGKAYINEVADFNCSIVSVAFCDSFGIESPKFVYPDDCKECWNTRPNYEVIGKVREALENLACLGNGKECGNSEGNMIARQALALLDAAMKGENSNKT